MTKKFEAKLRDCVRNRTREFAKEFDKLDNKKLSEKQKKMLELIKSAFERGDFGTSICTLFAEQADLDPKMILKEKTVMFKPLTAVVPIKRIIGSHNYPLDKVTLMCDSLHGLRTDGTMGNSLTNDKRYVRPATEAEQKTITCKQLTELAGVLTIIEL